MRAQPGTRRLAYYPEKALTKLRDDGLIHFVIGKGGLAR
jgi:hypothetical protein